MRIPAFTLLSSLVLSTALTTGCATMSGSSPAQVVDGVLIGSNKMTLYTFDKDVAGSGKSVCNGPCAANWPPLLAKDGDVATGHYTIITRDDGKKQWALKGQPLYHWVKDSKPGDRTGDGFNKVWQVARP